MDAARWKVRHYGYPGRARRYDLVCRTVRQLYWTLLPRNGTLSTLPLAHDHGARSQSCRQDAHAAERAQRPGAGCARKRLVYGTERGRTGTFTAYYVPSTGGTGAGALYGLVVTPDNNVWVTVSAENAIARLDVAAHRFTPYRIPTDSSLPIGIVAGANHTLWFTEAGSNSVGMMQA